MRRLVALLAITLLAALPAAPASGAEPAIRPVHWTPCYPEWGPNFECATYRVPLDYDEPNGRRISLALVRQPAARPESRLGSIFFNPGGPGGSGVDFILQLAPFLYTQELRDRFDFVGFDPRGIIRSSPLLCFKTFEDAVSIFPDLAFPVTDEEEALWVQADNVLAGACERRGGAILDHMSTANVARDLDVLRQAVGDEQLNYVGYSYGSFLGVTYANMFPDRVRAVVVDGVLDPIAWTTGRGDEAATLPFSTRLRSDAGAYASLLEFFRLCDAAGTAGCAFSGNSQQRFADLAARLLAEPVEVVDPSTGEVFLVGYDDLVAETLFALYSSSSWQAHAALLAELEALADPAALGAALAAVHAEVGVGSRPGERPTRYPNFVEGGPGVFCSDSDNPDDPAHWSTAADASDAQFPYFGRFWTWISSICAPWTGFDEDRYTGPFTNATANPVLVVGTRFDPATRYEGALIVDELLPNSSLLTVEGWAHTSLFLSACADMAVAQYLTDGTPPAPGATCTQDFDPFAPIAADVAARLDTRAEAMEEVAAIAA